MLYSQSEYQSDWFDLRYIFIPFLVYLQPGSGSLLSQSFFVHRVDLSAEFLG